MDDEPLDLIEEARRQWQAHFDDAPLAAMAGVTSIMRAQQILLARLNELLDPFELTFARYEALMLLFYTRHGELPLGKMGVRLQVHRTSVTNIVDGLEKGGLVVRVPHPTDRRTVLATLTDRGREVAREASATLHAARFGTEPMSDDELDGITRLLRSFRLAADR